MTYKEILLFVVFYIWKATANDCIPRKYEYDSIVCVCNSTYCDSTPDVEEPEKGSYHVYVSSKDGFRLSFSKGKFEESNPEAILNTESYKTFSVNAINVDRNIKYQTIQGFGAAFTDSVGIHLKNLSTETRGMLFQSYFGRNGSRYNFARIPIGGCDFSVRKYSLDDTIEPDENLEHFELAEEDLVYKIPFLKDALNLSPDMKIVAAVWSPPIWMKTNNKFYGLGVLKKKYYQTYANYILKFLQEYKSHGIDVSFISTGNEPSDAFTPNFPLNCMGWLPNDLGHWVADYLGPTLSRSEHNQTSILVLDDQRLFLVNYIDLLLSNKKALSYTSGIAVHWYLDEYFSPTLLDMIHNKYSNVYFLMTEACTGFKANDNPKVQLGSWERGEEYILNIIQNLRHWVEGWIDWNIVLDKTGGPNIIDNFVDSPIIVNSTNDEFYKQPMYYALKHFSRFVERGSVRIDSTVSKHIQSIAFETTTKMIVVVLYNTSSKAKNVSILDSKNGVIKIEMPPYSIYTVLYK